MKLVKELTIKGTTLDKYQLEMYMQKIASTHNIKKFSNKATYPIQHLKENFAYITKTYHLLNEHIKLGINIHGAGEWLLDNYYIIEETVKSVINELTLKKYTNQIGLENPEYEGFSRIYVLSSEIVAYTDGKIEEENLKQLVKAYQTKKTLSMEEIWNIQIFLRISLVKNIKDICQRIYSSQVQKYKVESIVERLVEKKNKNDQKFKLSNFYETEKIFNYKMKYPFIEHMSFKLKQYGKRSYSYLKILEEEVEKTGTTVSEVIKKEHFEIAIQKVLIANSITSLKNIMRIDFMALFEQINEVEEILKKDPSQIYLKMDYKTKTYYRNTIKEISEQTKISEIYISFKLIELCEKADKSEQEKEKHIGYYLLEENGLKKLYAAINSYPRTVSKKNPEFFIATTMLVPLMVTLLITGYYSYVTKNAIISFFIGFILYILITEIYIKCQNYIITKVVKPKFIPKLDFSTGIPKEYKTFVVVPTIVKNGKKVEELFRKLEVYYLANKSENIYFALLGDCSSGSKEIESFDEEVIKTGSSLIEKLNKKYTKEGEFPKFHFLYRQRKWNEKEKCYLGWERKRGLLTEFNSFLLNNEKNFFKYNSITYLKDNFNTNTIKYVITLDCDTELVLNSGLELIGSMAHILNKPKIENGIVKEGHGIMQPRVGVDLNSSRKSLFTKIYADLGGTDLYANAISDVYQDCFEEGIFAGKGIYDLHVFHEVLKDAIPENTVLSHDLLEGNYLRCGLVSDIMLLDGWPAKYNSNIARTSRWTRGDWQIIQWIGKKVRNREGKTIGNPLFELSKFKILDNLRRSLIPVTAIISILLLFSMKLFFNIKIGISLTIVLVSLLIPTILDLINYIVFKKQVGDEYISAKKNFSSGIKGIVATIIRGILEIGFLPHKAYVFIGSIAKTLYRLKITKQNMLEWQTSEEAERQAKTDLISYYKNMWINILIGILALLSILICESVLYKTILAILGILWLLSPEIAWNISKEVKTKEKIEELSEKEKEKLLEIGKRTWDFFGDHLTEENNYLMPDNYQEDRKKKVAHRTSPTNIGLSMLSVISSYDLKYINFETSIFYLSKILENVEHLSKWNGHLYNWYQTKTKEILSPMYISTVDSGNFIGYLYIVKQFLLENKEKLVKNINIENLMERVDYIIKETDFSYLYNTKNKLFSIGFNIEENKLTDSYYDLLASEARQTSLVAIAKKDVEAKHWNSLSRTLTTLNKYKGLISWSGTSFEYLMSNVNVKKYPGSLLDESCKFMLMCQKEYAKKIGISWGISESAFYLKDLNGNYQYKAFGIPWLGLKRGLADEAVVSPYGSILAITDSPKDVMDNLNRLEKEEMYGKYGFYEAIDYTPSRLKTGETKAIVKTYMAHHQGLILSSINNLFHNYILQNRFFANPEVEAIDILLQERMPENVIITKEQKEKIGKLKYADYESYVEKVITKTNDHLNNLNVISNEKYTVCMNEKRRRI